MYIALVLSTVVLTAFWGWRKGLLRLILRLAAFLLAYALAWQETPAFAGFLEREAGLSVVTAWPAAGLLLLVGGSVVFAGLASWLASLAAEHWDIDSGRWTGGLLGAALGFGIGLLLVWTVGTLRDGWQQRTATPAAGVAGVAAEDGINGRLRTWSGEALAALAGQALGDSAAAPAAEALVRNPVSLGQDLQYFARKAELQRLLQDPVNYAVLVRGPAAAVMQLADFRALVVDERVMQFLGTVGLPGQGRAEQAEALAGILTRHVGNYEKLRNTPAFQAVAADPELRAKLQQGNLLLLLTDDKMRQLADMLAHGVPQLPSGNAPVPAVKPGGANGAAGHQVTVQPPAVESPAKPLYRWKDAQGRLHITDQPPPEGVQADVIQP